MSFIKNTLLTISSILLIENSLIFGVPGAVPSEPKTLASHSMSLDNRYSVQSVNEVMRDNILLSLAYLRGVIKDPKNINWEEVQKPFSYVFTLKHGEVYAFQKDSLPEFENSVTITKDIHFASQEGFKTDGYLFGDGVCHLASLFYWVAKDAGLNSAAPTNHNFAQIPEIPREYGVAIYSQPNEHTSNANQNLYIKNNKETPVQFEIEYDGKKLEAKITQNPEGTNPANITQEVI